MRSEEPLQAILQSVVFAGAALGALRGLFGTPGRRLGRADHRDRPPSLADR